MKIIHKLAAASVAALAVLSAGPASARVFDGGVDFTACDGFGAPSKSGDGMSEQALVMGIFVPDQGGDTVQRDVAMGAGGVAACGRALEDPRLLPAYWRRKVSLIRARAAHRMAEGDVAGGLADLDLAASAAVQPDDPFYRRAQGAGIELLRAYGMRVSGDRAGAVALAKRVVEARPYDRQTIVSALLALDITVDDADHRALARAAVRVDPGLIDVMFEEAIAARRYAEAVALYPHLDGPSLSTLLSDLPYAAGEAAFYRGLARWTDRDQVFKIRTAGQAAYAQAALGRPDQARAIIEAARADLLKAGEPRAEPNAKPHIIEYDQLRAAVVKRRMPDLEAVKALVELRIAAAADPAGVPIPETLVQAGNPVMRELADVVLPSRKGPDTPAIAKLRQVSRAPVAAPPLSPAKDVGYLFSQLPEPEVRERLERYRKPKPGKRYGALSPGYETQQEFSYDGFDSSPSMVAEAALLQAAEYARSKGFAGFAVVSRGDVRQSVQPTMYGQPSGPVHHTGYETSVDILPVDPAAPPAVIADVAWRVLDTDAVIAALLPVYGPKSELRRK